MKKLWLSLILVMLSLFGCKSLETEKKSSIKVNLVGDFAPKDNLTVLLFAYDERIADKKADLVGKEVVALKSEENFVEFIVPKDTRTYYISLEDNKNYSIDYSSGSITKLEFEKNNEVKINKKSN